MKLRIGDVCDINSRTIGKTNNLTRFEYLDTGSITDNVMSSVQTFDKFEEMPSRARRLVKKNTILYSAVRPSQKHFGFIADDTELIVSTGFITIDVRDIHQIDPKYLYFRLTESHITEFLHNIAKNNASSYPSLNPEDIEDLEFEIPGEIKEQRRIANLLTEFEIRRNASIQLSRKLSEILDRTYRSLFIECHRETQEFFLRKFASRGSTSTKVISKLGDLATISKRTISTQGLESNSFWHYSIPAFDTEGYPELTMGREIASNKYILETNCVMVSKLNPEFERIWTVIDPLPNSISSTEFVILLPKDHSYLAFINSFVRSSDFHKYMIAFATGSTGSRQRFTPEDILSIQIGSFDIELIKTFSKFALPLLKQINISGRAQHSLGKFVQRNFTYLISNVA